MANKIFGVFIRYMFAILLLPFNKHFSRSQLVVNVKTVYGQLTQQQIVADPEQDIVTINFSYADGTKIEALIDFPKVRYSEPPFTNTFLVRKLMLF